MTWVCDHYPCILLKCAQIEITDGNSTVLILRVTVMFSLSIHHLISVENGNTNITSMSFDNLHPSNFYNFSVKYYCENNCFLTTKASTTDKTSIDTTTTITTTITVKKTTDATSTDTATTSTATSGTTMIDSVASADTTITTSTATSGTTMINSVAPIDTTTTTTTAVKINRRRRFTSNSENKNYNYVLVTNVLFYKLSDLSSFSLAPGQFIVTNSKANPIIATICRFWEW